MASVSGHAWQHPLGQEWRVPRSRGALSGLLLVVLGIWGGLVPFLGPQFGYGYTPGVPWAFTMTRFFLAILPAAAVILGGLGLMSASHRLGGLLAGALAALGGAWFVVGPRLSVLFGSPPGVPLAHGVLGMSMTEIGLFSGLGVVVLFLAALGIGRFSVTPTGRHSTAGAAPTTRHEAPPEEGTS
jgi:hypothetical protein